MKKNNLNTSDVLQFIYDEFLKQLPKPKLFAYFWLIITKKCLKKLIEDSTKKGHVLMKLPDPEIFEVLLEKNYEHFESWEYVPHIGSLELHDNSDNTTAELTLHVDLDYDETNIFVNLVLWNDNKLSIYWHGTSEEDDVKESTVMKTYRKLFKKLPMIEAKDLSTLKNLRPRKLSVTQFMKAIRELISITGEIKNEIEKVIAAEDHVSIPLAEVK